MNYYHESLKPFMYRFMSAPDEWLQSKEGRSLIAKTLRLIRNKYNRDEAKKFKTYMIGMGINYFKG